MSEGVYSKGRSGYAPLTAGVIASSIGPVTESGRYQISCSGSTVYLKQSTTQADAETVTDPSGAVRGLELFVNNAIDIYLDSGDYVGVITASGSATINLHYVRSY